MHALIRNLFWGVALSAMAGTVLAAPAGGLYKAEIPPGAALVRIFNAGAPIMAGKARMGERPMSAMDTGELTAYSVVTAGARTVSCGGKPFPVDVQVGKFQTLVCGGKHEGALLLDPIPVHANKTFLIFYNLTETGGYSLKTANGKVAVIDPVATAGTGSREINPVRVELSVFKEAAAAFKLGQVVLAPEKVYGVFLIQVGDEVRAYLRESQLNAEV